VDPAKFKLVGGSDKFASGVPGRAGFVPPCLIVCVNNEPSMDSAPEFKNRYKLMRFPNTYLPAHEIAALDEPGRRAAEAGLILPADDTLVASIVADEDFVVLRWLAVGAADWLAGGYPPLGAAAAALPPAMQAVQPKSLVESFSRRAD
jgi:hypothetical protein